MKGTVLHYQTECFRNVSHSELAFSTYGVSLFNIQIYIILKSSCCFKKTNYLLIIQLWIFLLHCIQESQAVERTIKKVYRPQQSNANSLGVSDRTPFHSFGPGFCPRFFGFIFCLIPWIDILQGCFHTLLTTMMLFCLKLFYVGSLCSQ